MDASATDRAIVLTGASGGVGLAVTDRLLAGGIVNVALQYRRSGEELFAVVRRHGLDPERHCFQADLSREEDVSAFGAGVRRVFGAPWGLVNLVGASSNALSWKLSLAEFEAVLAGNLTSTFLTCREFIPDMREARGGRIVNTSSILAFKGGAGASHYSAAKAGIVGFTKAIARELSSRDVTANVLALGYFDYGMTYTIPEDLREEIRGEIPLRRFGTAQEVAATMLHLLSDDGAYTTGQVLHVNGGLYV